MKNVLIIGASGDIGLAIAEQLAREGHQLILHYHQNKDSIDALRSRIDKELVLSVLQADLRYQSGIENLLQELVYPIDYIIFAGGSAYIGLFQEMPETVMDDLLSLHVKAPWLITKRILPEMIQRRFGKIVFITSIWGERGASLEVAYSSVKGAQNSFVKALAKEVAASGISVNAISPGFIDTKMNAHIQKMDKESLVAEIPMQRPGLPAEIAHTVQFLLNHQSSYIQGEVLNVDGAW